jgi:nucleoside-diphosphate-sugar epimerase
MSSRNAAGEVPRHLHAVEQDLALVGEMPEERPLGQPREPGDFRTVVWSNPCPAQSVSAACASRPRAFGSHGPAVHVLDAAHLFRLAAEQAPAGSRLHAVGDEGVPVRDIAEVIGRHLNLPTASVPAEDFGFLGQILAIDQPASSALTRELLGWRPVQPGLIEDLDKGHYFA